MSRTTARESETPSLTGLPRATIHQLRTPLTAIRGYAQLLSRGVRDPEQQQRACQTILRESDRLAQMLDQLSRSAEVRLGSLEQRPALLELGDLARSAVNGAARRWPEHRFSLRDEAPVWVYADPQQLAAVLGHLLDNAAAFSEPGSEVETTVASRQDQAEVRVCDEGIGIPADELEQIFECFVRASNASQAGPSRSLGLGVSLYLARAAAELAGGRVWAENNARQGATFHLELPLAR